MEQFSKYKVTLFFLVSTEILGCVNVKHILICSSSRIELGDVTPHNIKQLKRLNQVIFPVSYNDKFYKDVLEVGELAKLGTNVLASIVGCGVPSLMLLSSRSFYFVASHNDK